MTVAVNNYKTNIDLPSRLINGILAIKPLANFAKHQAREMMIKRAEEIGVAWRKESEELLSHNWEQEFNTVNNPNLIYPDYYLTSFHAYNEGNMSWKAATEVEVAAKAVHAKIWPEARSQGDAKLRHNYHEILKSSLPITPEDIVDIGCSVGMSTFALQDIYPDAHVTGVDLSPYFLSVALYNSQKENRQIKWVHNAGENTGLSAASCDLVSSFLVFHELPQDASRQIIREARRLLRPNGYLAIMDMNPKSEIFAQLPPYVLTLLKSTEPYLDQYFTLDIDRAFLDAGFEKPTISQNSPRHRTIIAKVRE